MALHLGKDVMSPSPGAGSVPVAGGAVAPRRGGARRARRGSVTLRSHEDVVPSFGDIVPEGVGHVQNTDGEPGIDVVEPGGQSGVQAGD